MTRAKQEQRLPVRIDRKTPAPVLRPFTDYFKGFEKVAAVRAVFGDETDAVLSRLKIGFVSNRRMYMGIRDEDGNVAVGTFHLTHSDKHVLYLDVVHELFHIKQWMGDKEWFTEEHMKFMGDFSLYYSSPLEVPAYRHTVREAERLGMHHKEIEEYLKMGPVPPKQFAAFLAEMGIRRSPGALPPLKARWKLPVKINRNPSLALYPFTDYFKGFEKVAAVKALFGARTKDVLGKTEVEFVDIPWGSIYPSDDDGHLVVSSTYIKKADVDSIYLDVILSLNFLKRFGEQGGGTPSPDRGFEDDPVVLESYKAMVKEARRIGTPDSRIPEHLQLPRFMMSGPAYKRFVGALGLAKAARKA